MPRTAKTTANTAETAEKATEAVTPTKETTKAEKAPKKPSQWTVKVSGNPKYCGTGACGLQFAYGKCVTDNPRAVAWYKEHDGYEVVAE